MPVKHSASDNLPGGILAINKPEGMTSHDVVNKLRRLYNTKRVGHAGTLDPIAEGVLVVLVGRAAKACEYISSDKKTYTATLRLGITTDTEDITGQVLTEHKGELPTFIQVREACESFKGKIKQIPPMYSALKVDGQKLYDLARKGVTVERQAREIEIFSLSASETDVAGDYTLRVECSGGTYIRTLCADIGAHLGCGGVMATLRRDEACGIRLSDCYTVEQISDMSDWEKQSILLNTEKIFEDIPCVSLPAFYERLFRDGCPIYQKKIKTDLVVGRRVRVASADGEFFALGEVCEYPDGEAIRSIKIFKL